MLFSKYNIEFGGGLGDFKGKVWRIGLIGNNAQPNCVFAGLAALEECLQVQGVRVCPRHQHRRGGTSVHGKRVPGLGVQGKGPGSTDQRLRKLQISN